MKLGNKKYLGYFIIASGFISVVNGLMNIQYGALTDLAFNTNFNGMIEVAKNIILIGTALMLGVFLSNLSEKYYLKMTMTHLKQNYIDALLKRHRLTKNKSVYISHMSHDADRLEQQYYLSLLQLFHLLIKIAVATIILSQYSYVFIIVVGVLAFIFFSIARKTSESVKEEEKVKSLALQGYTNFVEESLNGFSVIKSHQIETSRETLFESSIEGLKKQHFIIEKQKSLVDALNGIVQGVIIASLMVIGLYIGAQLGLSIGSNMVVVLLFGDLLWPLQRVTPLITELSGMKSVMEDYEQALLEPEESGKGSIQSFEKIEFQGAHLGYDETILSNVNICINAHEKVLIVGPSGAGKSTILKTLQRDIEVLSGLVTMNGNVLSSYDLTQYYNLISVVDQIGFIFSGTIQENITMLQNNPVENLLKEVSLSHLDTDFNLINNGDNVSGGERARLLLARALYFNKELVVCDEILSSLDSNVAKAIEKDILDHAQTLINVSHIVFLENLPYYDKFVIVDHGSVVVTDDMNKVLQRMRDTDIEFK